MTLRTDTRGASIPVTHALTIAITALLMGSLLVGAGTFLSNQQETAARAQLSSVGGDVVQQLSTLDRLNETGESVTASMNASYKRTAAGAPYTIHLDPDSGSPARSARLYVNSTALAHPINLSVSTDTPLVENRVRGQNPTIRLCDTSSGQRLTLGACPP